MNKIRNLAVFIDGTNMDFGKNARTAWSNVTRLYKACKSLNWQDDIQQIVQYFDGIGSRKSESVLLDQALGAGLNTRVSEAYGWLQKEVHNAQKAGCEPRIYLFGFSRGAFAVRWLAALIDFCGIPTEQENKTTGLNVFGRRDVNEAAKLLASNRFVKAPIEMIGVFDTVKARPGSDYGVGMLAKLAKFAAHAVALDEWRANFDVLLFDESKHTSDQSIAQVWFAGGHSDIGGGYGDPEATDEKTLRSRLASDVTLKWMMSHAMDHGLLLNTSPDAIVISEDIKPEIHDERTWFYVVSNVFSKAVRLFLRAIPVNAVMDATVARWEKRFDLYHKNKSVSSCRKKG